MSFKSRLKFFFGLLFVVFLVGALLVNLNNSMSVARSSKALLGADSVTIGTDYPGLVVKQNVEEGDKFKKGDTLFEISSQQLNDALTNKSVKVASLPFDLSADEQNILVEAKEDGVIQKINYRSGSYVPAGGILAITNTVGSLYVEGHYRLSPPDYARIKKGSMLAVTFPDNSKIEAIIYSVSLVSDGSEVDTVIKARLQHADVTDFRFSVNTPVQAVLKLTDKTWYQNLNELAHKLFRPSGR